ncbi:hypothetical protein Kpol_1033p22 [Vanderwaltozyma polyspora DSM 70294]|uniref:Cell division control protein 45 n=1 Tax=Vanderwaltozyma polyspora (strain ATCC 22028 / DSM 70294 / BCRC 21397 / CBS 2163 / NBRC 10782 / NRRL Y-8283 / UCD 57-17) TaxID=436907 RepID=A7TJ19_VANPO|nr:uncharacterized protein Kpol_1033p22 [Vanderwaltozyma polyspora DSM 70294]EDO17718.1 hypothetical protein Kpol_1033p22 [Vanderwaltozyma polyspora DSM 70294]
MYYSLDRIPDAYHEILRNSSSHSSCQLVIFVSCLNIDALCATKILSILFKKQLVQLQIVPVFGYLELRRHYKQLDDNINSVMFVGCGAAVDLESFLEIDPDAYLIGEDDNGKKTFSRTLYVLDERRPWSLDNLFGSELVKCFDDGTVDETLDQQKKSYNELLKLEAGNLEEDGTDDDDDDDDDDNDDEKSDDDGEEDFDNNGQETDDDNKNEDDIVSGEKRPNDSEESSKKRKRKQRKRLMNKHEAILEEYYSQGTTVVNSISTQVYSLVSSLGESNLQYLWLTILGASSLDASYPQVYNRLSPILQDEVKRLSTRRTSTKTPDSLSVDIQPDYYLFLLRHSSLYDSFYYSNYVNAKLSLWNENGKKRLHKMFARMGIPLNTAQEHWLYMDHSIKRELAVIFDKNLDRYGLQDIIRDGFIRTFGYHGSTSASEFVEALTALLEVGNSISSGDRDNKDDTSNNNEDNDDENNNEIDNNKNQKKWISNFWLSWDALDDKNPDLLQKGIRHAQFLQKAIFNTGVAILEKKLLKNLRIYRLCVLQDGPDLDLFTNPLTLLRLGNWLIECCAELEDKQLLPMVIASLNESTDTYLVAGLSPRYPRGLDNLMAKKPILNNFAMAFQQITAQTGAKLKIDNFETTIIEVHREDLSPFLEKLTLSGLL